MVKFREDNQLFIPSKSIYIQIGSLYCLTNTTKLSGVSTMLAMPVAIILNSDEIMFKFIYSRWQDDKFEYTKPNQITFHNSFDKKSYVLSNIDIINIFSGKNKIHNNKKLTNIIYDRFHSSVEGPISSKKDMRGCNIHPLGIRLANLIHWELREIQIWYTHHLNMHDNLGYNNSHQKEMLIEKMQKRVTIRNNKNRSYSLGISNDLIPDINLLSHSPSINNSNSSYDIIINDSYIISDSRTLDDIKILVVYSHGTGFSELFTIYNTMHGLKLDNIINDIHKYAQYSSQIEILIFKKEAGHLIVGNVLPDSVNFLELIGLIKTGKIFCRNLINIKNRDFDRIQIHTKKYSEGHNPWKKYILTDPYKKNMPGAEGKRPEITSTMAKRLKNLNIEGSTRKYINKALLELDYY